MGPVRSRWSQVLLAGVILLVLALPATAHDERPAEFPPGTGSVPTYRTSGPYLLVCKVDDAAFAARIAGFPDALKAQNQALYQECKTTGFRHLQEAVDNVTTQGTRILVLPGVYHEEPSLTPQTGACAGLEDQNPLTYQQQWDCRHAHNLVAILGDDPADADSSCDNALCALQVEGTGQAFTDVVVDGRFHKLNVVRADRADGVYFRNFTVQHSQFNALYILETDGFAIDRMLGRWNDEYGFLTFADDHGLYTDCEAYGNGDAGLYPGSASDINKNQGLNVIRYAIEIKNCSSHHNTLGYSGTAGNSVWVHDNDFSHNSTGVSTDSAFPDHPGLPQDHSRFQGNRVSSNNENYYGYIRDGTCDQPYADRGYDQGVVCPTVLVPVGTGYLLAGGNYNLYDLNQVYDNWRYGFMQFYVPAAVRGDTDPTHQFDTSHYNRYLDNSLASGSDGSVKPNGLDFWWDEQGIGNCWEGNVSAAGKVTSDPPKLPDCKKPSSSLTPNPVKSASIAPCALYDRSNPIPVLRDILRDPPACAWDATPSPPPEPDSKPKPKPTK